MLRAPATTRRNFSAPAFLATSVALLLILFIRTTRGLDLTDEMQYYGEIKGLVETGRLFSNDLFIQQSVYILLYPAFYLYHVIFGFDGLVLFGRLVMSVLSAGVFAYAYQKLVGLDFARPVASLTALSLTFAIPYHGIFAPSYNTISQILWIIFSVRFFEWKRSSVLSWGVLPVIMAFAHPTSALMMTLLICARLLAEGEIDRIGKLVLVFLGGALIALPTVLNFALAQDYLTSLNFSSGYGVGTVFFSDVHQPIYLAGIFAMFGGCVLVWKRLNRFDLSMPMALLLAIAINLFWRGVTQGGYSFRVVQLLSLLTALAYVWTLANLPIGDSKARLRIHWLVTFILMFATTLGITSGNGIGQATGAFMIGLPLLLGIAVTSAASNRILSRSSFIGLVCVALVSILFASHWSRFAYREDYWWRTSTLIEYVPEFRFISTSSERTNFIYGMQQAFAKATESKRTLIISNYPALYLALHTIPETCMLYMHSIGSDISEKTLLECFEKKSPQIIINVSGDKDKSSGAARLEATMRNYIIGKGYVCDVGSMKFDSNDNLNPAQLKVSVCKRAA